MKEKDKEADNHNSCVSPGRDGASTGRPASSRASSAGGVTFVGGDGDAEADQEGADDAASTSTSQTQRDGVNRVLQDLMKTEGREAGSSSAIPFTALGPETCNKVIYYLFIPSQNMNLRKGYHFELYSFRKPERFHLSAVSSYTAYHVQLARKIQFYRDSHLRVI